MRGSFPLRLSSLSLVDEQIAKLLAQRMFKKKNESSGEANGI